jgi:hypothetical protein
MAQTRLGNYEQARAAFCGVAGELGEEFGFRLADLPSVYAVHDAITAGWHHLDRTEDMEGARSAIRESLLAAAGIEVEYGQYAAA